MAYTRILKALHRNLKQTATHFAAQTCYLPAASLLIHTHRPVSTVSRLTFHRGVEARSCVLPTLSCFVQAQTRRAVSLHFTARNKSSPEDRDSGQQSVSRYQSGSPKPSAAQKGEPCTGTLVSDL